MKSVNGYNVWRGLPGLYTVYCGSCQCVVNYVYSRGCTDTDTLNQQIQEM